MWGNGASGAKKYIYLITYHIDLSINIVYHKKCNIASGKFAPILSNTPVNNMWSRRSAIERCRSSATAQLLSNKILGGNHFVAE